MTSHSLASMIVSHCDELSRDSKLNRETIIGNWIEEHKNAPDKNMKTPLQRWMAGEISAGKFAELIGVQRHIADELLVDVYCLLEKLRIAKSSKQPLTPPPDFDTVE